MPASLPVNDKLSLSLIKGERRTMINLKSRMIAAVAVFLLFCSGLWIAGSSVSAGGGNRCSDHCADTYKIKKDACRLIPFKNERKICERRAKETKNDCKHRCR